MGILITNTNLYRMNKFIVIAAISVLCVFTGCKNASRQKTDSVTALSSGADTSQNKPDEIEIDGTPYPALNKLLELPENAKNTAIPLPVSLDSYYDFGVKNPGYQLAGGLISFLETIGFEGVECNLCHTLPFRAKNILPVLLCACVGDSDYYLVVTIDAGRGKVIGHAEAGEVTDDGIISFRINEDFRITQFKAERVYNEPDNSYHFVDKERLNSYRLGVDGRISRDSMSKTNQQPDK